MENKKAFTVLAGMIGGVVGFLLGGIISLMIETIFFMPYFLFTMGFGFVAVLSAYTWPLLFVAAGAVAGVLFQKKVIAPRQTQEKTAQASGQLKINRSLGKFILLSIVTLGIYPIIVFSGISEDINTIATPHDNKKTMHFALMFFLLAPLTFGIGGLVWSHKLCERIGNELRRRGIDFSFSVTDFWLWGVLGSIIIFGPFVYIHKLFTAMNQLAEDFNANN